ncbi:NUMOD3 domain-containing DNA-binding protein [Herbaspirillum sp. SJZ107]|uniref:NUMOD3 domain-containing DNA-binding protein n=1 Tax=Herbaspirillum sp. SJZ107 TaxID=2572881 RepID=UPI0011544F7A|nr:NUMOD3 domain-containing DNA-binding protein [Herbaspirillum sp. SJZ107]TQK06958.1 NUMOD3 motif-containing protein [Herbaspirillum sp. SJZ107]
MPYYRVTYYIYLHRRLDTGDVFYVGKGTKSQKHQYQRAYEKKRRSALWSRIVAKANYQVEIIAEFFAEEDCFAMERELIALYRRRYDGGTLCNLTLGGDGLSGLTPSEATKQKLREANSGEKHINWGKKLSEETRRKKSESMKNSDKNLRGKKLPEWWKDRIRATKFGEANPMFGRTGEQSKMSRKVMNFETGEIYASVTLAAKAIGMPMKTLYNRMVKDKKHGTSATVMRFVGEGRSNEFTPEHKKAISKARQGYVPSPEQVARHSRFMSGPSNPLRGRKRSKSFTEKVSRGNHPAAKKVIDLSTGVVYGCIKDAAKAVGVGSNTVSSWLNGKTPNPTSLSFITNDVQALDPPSHLDKIT